MQGDLFRSVPSGSPKRNKFDLSHSRKFSAEMGYLYPVYVEHMVPGDKFRLNTETLIRFAPMVAPVMHRMKCYIHYFKVPYRLLWNEWENFITGGRLGDSVPDFPILAVGDTTKAYFGEGSLWDHLGLPSVTTGAVGQPIGVSALPFRAYQMIWNEYYRDQNLSAPVPFTLGGGDVSLEVSLLAGMRLRCFEKDYYTSVLPFAQRGPAVEMPISGVVEPVSTLTGSSLFTGASRKVSDGTLSSTGDMTSQLGVTNIGAAEPNKLDVDGFAELNDAGFLIESLRNSVRLQEWLEKQARGGSRYNETILQHFGVRSSDARLQRPEYLGGGVTPVAVSEVLSTFQDPTGGGDPQGNMAGHGIAFGNYAGFQDFFEEHCIVMGIMSVLPDTAYYQGVNRHWTKFDKLDYYWPSFANIGEQEVRVGELWYDQAGSEYQNLFGYQSRYAEYKYHPSSIHGAFRSSLDFWHMARKLESAPTLNTEFVDADPINRIFAVPGTPEEPVDHLYVNMFHRVDALRPIPYYGVPTL